MPLNHFENVLRPWRARHQNACAAHRQREVQPIAQSVSKKQFSHAEAAILLGHVQNALRVALGAHHHVVLQVHAGLGKSSGT